MAFLNSFEPVQAGNSATTVAQFVLPVGTNASSGVITYELLDASGVVYSSGGATNYTTTNAVNGVVAQADVTVVVPSNIPVTLTGSAYQVKLNLAIVGYPVYTMYSLVQVLPNTYVEQGASDLVEIKGNTCNLQLVLPTSQPYVTANLYWYNDILNSAPPTVTGPTAVSDGYMWQITLDTSTEVTPASLVPYQFVWSYGASSSSPLSSEASSVYIVTASVLQAVKDLMAKINKAKTSLGERPTFSSTEALTYLRLGADKFNAFGMPTNFSFTKATGGVRAFWLAFSEIEALRAQYMFEGESAFDFQGQAISLNVDRTQYYDGLASSVENQITEPARQFKVQLAKRGNLDGEGDVNPNALRQGAIGSIGISLSPVSNIRPYNATLWANGLRSIF